MKTNLFKSQTLAIGMLAFRLNGGGSGVFKLLTLAIGMLASVTSATAEEITATLVHTAGTRFGSAASVKNTVDGEKEYYNNDASAGWVGYAFAEFSFTIPEGESISKAELTWTATTSSRARDNRMYYLNAKTTLDYEKIASTQERYNYGNERTYIGNTNFANTKTSTTDVTDAVKAVSTAKQGYIIFQWTGNAGSATLAGKGSANAPILKITTVSASSATKYTIKYVDESGKDIKNAEEYDGVIGQKFTATAEDMAVIYTSDKKYIYVSGNETKVAVKETASNVITLKFREAAKYNYTVNNNIDDNSVTGTVFEGDNAKVAFSQYILKDGVLYETNKIDDNKKQFNWTFAVNEDNTVKTLNYKKTTINNVAYYSEAEKIDGLTIINSGNSAIRSSNSASAYAKDADVVFTTLPAGTYKLTSVICDFKGKDATAEFSFKAGEKVIFTHKANNINYDKATSGEFTLNKSTEISLAQGGNDKQGIDFVYIQRTGDATENATISEAGFATYATKYNVKVPESNDVKVMTVKVNAEGTAIELNEVKAGTVIPAGTGILVKAPAGNCDFVVTSDKVTELTSNDLKAATTDVTSEGAKYFALTKIGDKVGFALVEKDVVIPAGKAYLEVSKGTAAKFFSLDGEATGINSVKTAKADGAYYTLEGVKTTKPVKGLYIHNGKKIVVK